MVRLVSWLAEPAGMVSMALLIVVQDLRPVLRGCAEWVGLGKVGRASPGLWREIVSYLWNGAKTEGCGRFGKTRGQKPQIGEMFWKRSLRFES